MNPFTPDPDPPIWPHLLVLSCLSVPPPFFSGFNIHILAFLAELFEINCSHHTFTSKYFLMNLLRIFLCVTLMSLPDKMNSISLYHLICSQYSFIQFRILLRVKPCTWLLPLFSCLMMQHLYHMFDDFFYVFVTLYFVKSAGQSPCKTSYLLD